MNHRMLTALLVCLGVWTLTAGANACPFCDPQAAQTLGEEIRSAEIAVLARLAETPKPLPKDDELGPGLDAAKTKFEIVHVFKGQARLGETKPIEVLFFGQEPKGTVFYLTSLSKPEEKLSWNTPIRLSPAGEKYLKALVALPEKGPERLVFYLDYLEHADDLVAADAYDEFSRADYQDILKLKDQIDHDQMLAWIQDPQVSPTRRGLYLMLLGACDRKSDAAILEKMIRDDKREVKPRLDATIFCYLKLTGADGMPLIEDLFFKNHNSQYSDTYAAMQALRQLGQQETTVPRTRLLAAMRHMLDRPPLADLVIPDFARWQDWTVADRLVELFLKSDDKSSWVRVPIVNYLRACPLPAAKTHLAKLKEFDPESVKQAEEFFPYIKPEAADAAAPAGLASTTGLAAPAPAGPADVSPDRSVETNGSSWAGPTRPNGFLNFAPLLGLGLVFLLAVFLQGGRR